MKLNGQEESRDYKRAKPYAMVGAGKLASSIWKDGNEARGFHYSFNVFRLSSSGSVRQKFVASDLRHFVKLIHLLSATLADDGCFTMSEREELVDLAARLEHFIRWHV
jgi:hypothetical protein